MHLVLVSSSYTLHAVLPLNPEYCKICHSNADLQLSWMKQILCRRSADKLDRLLLAIKPVVEKRHSTGTDAAEVDRCNLASWHRWGYMPSWALLLNGPTKYRYRTIDAFQPNNFPLIFADRNSADNPNIGCGWGYYSCTYPRRDGQAEWAWVSWTNTGMTHSPQVVINPSTNRARRSLTLLMWPTPLPLC